MVDFIRKRLQVFVSSTYTDLRRQRQAAVEAILTAGHIPAGMELFTSGDESQMEVIKQWIDESDIFLLILGGRYGSLEPRTGKSYIQLEYEYAVEKGKPLFACVVTEAAQEKRVKEFGSGVLEAEHPQKLKEFHTLVLSRTSRFWDDFKDIKITVGETLAQLARREDLIGWIRPSQEANMPALADEIARLSKENADLRLRVMRWSRSSVSYDPAPAWKDYFSVLEMLTMAHRKYDDAINRKDGDAVKGDNIYISRKMAADADRDKKFWSDKLKEVLAALVFDVTGTSTEALLPQASQLVQDLIKDYGTAAQIDDFRRLVVKHLRTPNEVKSSDGLDIRAP